MGPGDGRRGRPADHAVEARRPPFHHVHVLQLAGEERLHRGLHRQPGAARQLVCKDSGQGWAPGGQGGGQPRTGGVTPGCPCTGMVLCWQGVPLPSPRTREMLGMQGGGRVPCPLLGRGAQPWGQGGDAEAGSASTVPRGLVQVQCSRLLQGSLCTDLQPPQEGNGTGMSLPDEGHTGLLEAQVSMQQAGSCCPSAAASLWGEGSCPAPCPLPLPGQQGHAGNQSWAHGGSGASWAENSWAEGRQLGVRGTAAVQTQLPGYQSSHRERHTPATGSRHPSLIPTPPPALTATLGGS